MTEKRFIIEVLDKNNWLIEDTKTGETANPIDGTTNVLKGLISTLNKFNDENEQLKQSYTKLKHRHSLLHDECLDAECDRDSYCKDVLSLEEENEQLKQENYDLVKLINDLGSEEMDRQMEEILND